MQLSCQNCGQLLPKTSRVCPNCGNRDFIQNSAVTQTASVENVTPIYAEPMHKATLDPIPEPMPEPAPLYMPPVAPPMPTVPIAPITPIAVPSPVYQPVTSLPPVSNLPLKPANTMRYAGLIRRGFAILFDIIFIFAIVQGGWWYYQGVGQSQSHYKLAMSASMLPYVPVVAGVVLFWLYSALLNSRARQGTWGKRMVGLWVYDMQGQRLSFSHALLRELVKLVLFPLVFILWFTARKQTLHDLVAGTVVLHDV